VTVTVVDGIVRYRREDPSVGGLKPVPDVIREPVRVLRSRMEEPGNGKRKTENEND
jgi:hypothetical protein